MSACVQSVHSLKSSLVDDATIQLCVKFSIFHRIIVIVIVKKD